MKKEFFSHLNNSAYKTVSWTPKQNLLYKMSQKNFDINELSSSEKIEYEKLFYKMFETPKESDIKKCILVIVHGNFSAIGLEIVNSNNILVFKSLEVEKTVTMCKKNNIIIRYEKQLGLAWSLFLQAYPNEVIPRNFWMDLAYTYMKIMKKNKKFTKKIRILFGI
jgi:hypothetical protein